MSLQTIIEFGFCDMQNYQGLDFDNSAYHKNLMQQLLIICRYHLYVTLLQFYYVPLPCLLYYRPPLLLETVSLSLRSPSPLVLSHSSHFVSEKCFSPSAI